MMSRRAPAIMSRRCRPPRGPSRPAELDGSPARPVAGLRARRPGPGPRRSRAGRRAPPRRRRLGAPRGLERLEPQRELRRQRRRVGAAGAVRGAVGVPLAGDLHQPRRRRRRRRSPARGGRRSRPRRAGPSAWTARASVRRRRPRVQSRSSARGLGHVGRDDRRARQQPRAQRVLRARRRAALAPLSATITGSSTTGAPPTRSRASSTASIVSTVPSMPILTASTPMSSATARTCSTIASRRHRVDGGDGDGVLGGDRGDRGHPVGAAGGEGLQVGLDAGAAAGVRAGDREQRGGWRRRHRDGIGRPARSVGDAGGRADHRGAPLPAAELRRTIQPPASSRPSAARTSGTRRAAWPRRPRSHRPRRPRTAPGRRRSASPDGAASALAASRRGAGTDAEQLVEHVLRRR